MSAQEDRDSRRGGPAWPIPVIGVFVLAALGLVALHGYFLRTNWRGEWALPMVALYAGLFLSGWATNRHYRRKRAQKP